MQSALVSLVLSGFVRDALKIVAGLTVAVALVAVFVLSTCLALIQTVAGALLPGSLPSDALAFGAPRAAVFAGPAGQDRFAANHPPETADDASLMGPTQTAVLAIARAQLGRPYVWGGASPQTSFDCSGLVQWAYRQTGVGLPRTAQQQFDATVPVSRDRLEPGDLVFFERTYFDPHDRITHVGIYAGNGLMIDAAAAGVSVSPVFSGYWATVYAGAGRAPRARMATAAGTGGR